MWARRLLSSRAVLCAGAGAVAGVGALWEGVGPGIGAGERSRLLGRLIPAVRAAEPSGPPSRSRRQEFNFLADLVEETSPGLARPQLNKFHSDPADALPRTHFRPSSMLRTTGGG